MRSFSLAPRLVSLGFSLAAGCGSNSVPATVSRALEPFTALSVGDALIVEVAAGPPSVEVSGDASLVNQVVVQQRTAGVTLTSIDNNVLLTDLPLRVKLTTPSLVNISATQSSVVRVVGLDAPTLDVSADRGSRLILVGGTATLTVSAMGVADVDASNLAAGTVNVRALGGAMVVVSTPGTVQGSVADTSELVVLGGGRFDNVEVSRDGKVRAGP